MLIMGTSGNSLSGGLLGLGHRGKSFSKYCLQYMPIPVVIFRSPEKRAKNKQRRAKDLSRHAYRSMLVATGGKHEADSDITNTYELTFRILPDEEPHSASSQRRGPNPTSKRPSAKSTTKTYYSSLMDHPTEKYLSRNSPPSSDEEEDEYDGFEVMSGAQVLDQQRQLERLHNMEASEAAVLRNAEIMYDEDEAEIEPLDDFEHSKTAALRSTTLVDERYAKELQHETDQNPGSDATAADALFFAHRENPKTSIYTKGEAFAIRRVRQ